MAGLQDGEKMIVEQNGSTIWEEESFDADSPNVWHTRTVVESDPDESGSPTILCEWNMGETAENLSNGTLVVPIVFCSLFSHQPRPRVEEF